MYSIVKFQLMQIDFSPSNTQPPFGLEQLGQLLMQHWFNALIFFLALHILFNKEVSISFSINSQEQAMTAYTGNGPALDPNQGFVVQPASYEEVEEANAGSRPKKKKPKSAKKYSDRKANTFSNLTFVLSPDYAERHNIDPAIAREKIQNCKDYVQRYLRVAEKEKDKYGIPVSITLAQGLLESNAGDSRLAKESNNHFGIKCRSKCKGCTCRNYSDDDIYDMFRVFDSAWESYREHSILLNGKRYKHLLKLSDTDYKGWAHGLKKAGYATDKRYAHKLIKIIEQLHLERFDG